MTYQPSDHKAWTGTPSTRGTWQVEYKYRCRHCPYRSGSAALSDSHSHHFICGGCQKHVACRYSQGIHQADATCPLSGCNATNVYRCVSHTCPTPIGSTSPSGSIPPQTPPSDGTPNCPDCTSDCSSPCGCMNSGTCGGSVVYHACGEHLTSVSGDHSWGAYTCGDATHVGYRCQESSDHKTYIASCTSTDSNGNTCTNSSGLYECQPHTHTYPSTLVACGGASYTGCSGASSRTAHHVPLCSNGCGNGYWTCDPNASRHTEVKRCKRSGCGASLTKCQNGPKACVRAGKPSNWHWL